jgi:hypothetical protein
MEIIDWLSKKLHKSLEYAGRFRNALGLSKICAKTLDWWSPPKIKWRQKSFEKRHHRWQDVGLQLWHWNQTTIFMLEESYFASHKKAWQVHSRVKAMLFFFDLQSTGHYEFSPEGQKINQDFNLIILRSLWDPVWRKWPEMWTVGSWYLT